MVSRPQPNLACPHRTWPSLTDARLACDCHSLPNPTGLSARTIPHHIIANLALPNHCSPDPIPSWSNLCRPRLAQQFLARPNHAGHFCPEPYLTGPAPTKHCLAQPDRTSPYQTGAFAPEPYQNKPGLSVPIATQPYLTKPAFRPEPCHTEDYHSKPHRTIP